MTTTPGRLSIDAELQIDHVRRIEENEVTVAVRCIRGPVRLSARFRHIRGMPTPIDLGLTGILFCGHPVDELDPVCTALVILRGTGTLPPTPGSTVRSGQIIQGSNPSVRPTRTDAPPTRRA
ncbi:hypothetical protein [Kitasatospora cineracea]|uniref:hypothetical protein n=1 Tax=Kitasatospora cineracea TaxID=88074 RepID=UPI0038251AA3